MIDWKAKLTSRKFWAAIAGFVTGLVVFIKNPTSDAQAITALIMATGSLVAYIVGEGLIDAAGARSDAPLIIDAGNVEGLGDEAEEEEENK